jgi:aryl-alcohol dehydrogenase-like predicted oxidoreductase
MQIAATPYSSLASGQLARSGSETTACHEADSIARMKYDANPAADQAIIDRVAEIAEKYAVPMTHISLAWMLRKNPVAAVCRYLWTHGSKNHHRR